LGVFGRIAKEDSSWATRWCRDAIEPWFIGQGRAVRSAIRVRGEWTTQAWRANREGQDLLSACIGSPCVILRADFARQWHSPLRGPSVVPGKRDRPQNARYQPIEVPPSRKFEPAR
jgi:hypothetical protein